LSDLEQFSTNAFLDFLAGRMVNGILRQMELATLPHTQPPKTRLSKKAPQCTSAKFIGTNADGKKDGNITNHAI